MLFHGEGSCCSKDEHFYADTRNKKLSYVDLRRGWVVRVVLKRDFFTEICKILCNLGFEEGVLACPYRDFPHSDSRWKILLLHER